MSSPLNTFHQRTIIEWAIGFGASIATSQGMVAFWLGVTVTVLTIYKILLDIQIKRRALKEIKAAEVDKKLDSEEHEI